MLSNIGPVQLLIVLLIVLAIFGTKRLRTLGSDLGSAVKGFRTAVNDADKEPEQIGDKSDLCDEMEADKLPEKYIENCTSELAQLSRKRDSIQKIEKK